MIVRRATKDDDLAELLGGDIGVHRLHPRSILVAESPRGIEGMLLLFDGGHSLVYADHLKVKADAPRLTGAWLIAGAKRDARSSGKTGIFFVTDGEGLVRLTARRGSIIKGPFYRVHYETHEGVHPCLTQG